jgi:predicted ATP-grasp superfamily ATP-dependent carboligase
MTIKQILESENQKQVNVTSETIDGDGLKSVSLSNRGSPLPHSVNFENVRFSILYSFTSFSDDTLFDNHCIII